jgi:hypothetical protein
MRLSLVYRIAWAAREVSPVGHKPDKNSSKLTPAKTLDTQLHPSYTAILMSKKPNR